MLVSDLHFRWCPVASPNFFWFLQITVFHLLNWIMKPWNHRLFPFSETGLAATWASDRTNQQTLWWVCSCYYFSIVLCFMFYDVTVNDYNVMHFSALWPNQLIFFQQADHAHLQLGLLPTIVDLLKTPWIQLDVTMHSDCVIIAGNLLAGTSTHGKKMRFDSKYAPYFGRDIIHGCHVVL